MQKFKTKLAGTATGPTGIEVPAKIIEALGAGKKPAVTVTVNNYTYRSTVAVMAGAFMIPFSSEHRAKSGIKAGDSISVNLAVDDKPRDVEIPKLLADALAKSKLTAKFASLAPSKRKEFVRQVNDAKAEETRDRRVEKILSDLSG